MTGREEIDRCLEGLAEMLPTCVSLNMSIMSIMLTTPLGFPVTQLV